MTKVSNEAVKMNKIIRYVIITVSDTRSQGKNTDLSGEKLKELVKKTGGFVTEQIIVPDEKLTITHELRKYADVNTTDVILTTGGTGFSPRDLTPEATLDVIEKRAQGLETAMTVESLKHTPFGMLSRGVCGIANGVLVINLPGSPKAATECFEALAHCIPHAVSVLSNDEDRVKATHAQILEGHKIVEANIKSEVSSNQVIGRCRHSKWKMIEVEEAEKLISQIVKKIKKDKEEISLLNGYGRVLAQNVLALVNVPAYDVSKKDGYAVRHVDGMNDRKVINHSEPATNFEKLPSVKENECIRITTGGPLPPGADAIIQVEDTEIILTDESKKEEAVIRVKTKPSLNLDVRGKGIDKKIGTVVKYEGSRILSVDLGSIISVGVKKILAFRKPIVAVMSTGNEVKDPYAVEELQAGAIYDSNRISLIAMFKRNGFQVLDMGIVPDNPTSILKTMIAAVSQADVIVTSGGVSMGEKDYVKLVLEKDLKAEIHFGRVNMKPGKPTTFATVVSNNETKLFFGLPGNPGSAIVASILFVLPALRQLEGELKYENKIVECCVESDVDYLLDLRPEYYCNQAEFKNHAVHTRIEAQRNSSDISYFSPDSFLVRLPGRTQDSPTLKGKCYCKGIFIGSYL